MMLVKKFLVLVLVTITAAVDECTTPNHQKGECKAINECQPLFALLQQDDPLPSSIRDYLRKSQCGFVNAYPKVCCPIGSSLPPTEAPSLVEGPNENTSVAITNSDVLPGTKVCGTPSVYRIDHGEKTELDEFPWMALIEYEKPGGNRGFYCGGVLISDRYVLTAAHCVKGKDFPKDWKLVSVRLGEYNTETANDCVNYGIGEDCAPPPINVPVEKNITHEDYDANDKNQYHDIALLRLKGNVTFTDYVRPICLPASLTEQNESYVGKKLFVAGWGKTLNSSESSSKLKGQVLVRNLSVCSSIYNFANISSESGQICAGEEERRDSCRGDSGGPLMALSQLKEEAHFRWFAAGVASFDPSSCGTQNWPKVYTKVSKYYSWIVGKLKF